MSRARATRRLTALTAATALVSGAGLVSGVFVGVASAQTTSSVAPSAISNNGAGATKFTVTGTGFSAALDTVTLIPKVQGDEVYADQTKFGAITTTVDTQNSTATALVFTADMRLAAPVPYDVKVSQSGIPSATVATCPSCIAVTNPARATVTGVAADGGAGAIVINGTNFARGAKVSFLKPDLTVDPAMTFSAGHDSTNAQTGVVTHTTGYPSSTTIKGQYTPAAGAVPGKHYLKVTNLDNQGSTQLVEFWQPKFTSVAPTTIGQGARNKPVTVTGEGIRDGSRLSVSNFSNTKADITVGPSSVVGSTTLTAPVSVAGADDSNAGGLSQRTSYVLGPDGGYTTGAGPTVTAPPTVSEIDVTTLGQGADKVPATITGTGFVTGVTFGISGTGITVETVSSTATSASVKITVAPDALVGDREELTATNPDGGTGVLGVDDTVPVLPVYPFTVVAGPVITAISPANLTPGAATAVTINGTGFATSGGATLSAHVPGAADTTKDIAFTGVTVVNATTITATATAPAAAPQGGQTVLVKNTTNKGQYSCVGCIGVDGISINPTTGPNSNNDFDITVTATGGNDLSGATGTVLRKVGAPSYQADIPGSYKSGTTLGFDLTSAATGKYDAVVTVPSGTVSCSACFTVTGSQASTTAPSTAVPAKGGQGAVDFPLNLVGTGFSHGMKVSIAGVTVSDATFADAQHISVKVTIPANLATGLKDVVVTNADGGFPQTITGGFNVVAAPTVTAPTAAAPAKVGQGAITFAVPVTGTGFSASSVTASGSGVSISTTTTNGTTLALSVTVAADAATGARDLVITNTDSGGRVTAPGALLVTPAPVVTLVSPARLAKGASSSLTISGQGFQSDSVPVIAGVSFTNVVVASGGGSLTATAAVSSGTATGTRDVRVNNTDGGSGKCTGCFTVDPPKTAPTFTLGTNTIAAGQKTKVLVVGVAGDQVQVNVKGAASSSYSVLASLTLNSEGKANLTVSPSTNSSYIVSNTAGPSAARTLTVKAVQTLVVKVSGKTGIFTGHIAPSVVGRTVFVYFYKTGDHVATACTTKTTQGGQFKCQKTFASGTYNIFAQTNADKYNAAGRSTLHTNTF